VVGNSLDQPQRNPIFGETSQEAQPQPENTSMIAHNSTLTLGVPNHRAAIQTSAFYFTSKKNMKKARTNTGAVIATAYYNETKGVEINGHKTTTATIGTVLALTSDTPVGSLRVDEIDINDGQDFQKFTINYSVPIED
jgi:hypothetical protein